MPTVGYHRTRRKERKRVALLPLPGDQGRLQEAEVSWDELEEADPELAGALGNALSTGMF